MILLPIAILAMNDGVDKAFMAQLYLDSRKYMYRIANNILRDEHGVEDAINDAFAALIKKVELLRTLDSCALRAYVVSTIRNMSFNLVTHRKRQGEHMFLEGDDVLHSIPSAEEGLDAALIRKQDIDLLRQALAALPVNERDILTMKYFDEMRDVEIAEILGVKPGSVRAYLTKARRHAQGILKELMKDE